MSNRRRNQNNQSDYTMDNLADSLLSRIMACVDQKVGMTDVSKGAIVTKVNEDGTVNVKLPADDSGQEFTHISNQSVYELYEGDSVELYLKGGRYSNCWVIAKHGMGGKRVALESQKGNTVVVSGGGTSSGGSSGDIPTSVLEHLTDYNNPHRVTKEQLGLSKVVTSINGESGDITIPTTINDAKLTIQQNGTEVGSFTANSSTDTTVNITVPTKISDLEDDSSFATKSELPTKTSQLTNDSGYITSADIPSIPVTTVNGQTGAVQLTATDVGALPDTTTIPDKTSQLSNDSGYITSAGAPIQTVNGKAGTVELVASDVGAISTDDISQTLGNSSTKVPSEKAVVDAMSAAGYGDMLKAKYANNSTDDTVDKAFSDANGKNITDTYVPKDGGTLTNIDANTLITTGNYLIGEGCTNFPDGSQGSVVQVVGAGGSAYQTTVIYATNTYAHRAYNGTTWTAWRDANGAVVSATQPEYQNIGSLWFKEI